MLSLVVVFCSLDFHPECASVLSSVWYPWLLRDCWEGVGAAIDSIRGLLIDTGAVCALVKDAQPSVCVRDAIISNNIVWYSVPAVAIQLEIFL